MSRRTVGVDTGGTFTDLVELSASGERCAKVPSVPAAPGRAVVEGLARLSDAGSSAGTHVVHGTTVALNALLTGAVARTALVTNQGFRDLIEIGRQERPALYALHPTRPAPLVPRERRFEVAQRTWPDADGALVEVARPSDAELAALAKKIGVSGAESIAVCLLHSYADPEPERRIGAALAELGLPVTLSSVVLPEHREHERFSTAIVNAALVPRMRAYLEGLGAGLEAELGGARLELLQSNGGTLPAEQAAREPVRVVFSGPAGGVVGAARAAREAGFDEIVALDMGGTSTDVAYHVAGTRVSGGGLADAVTHAVVAGQPIAVPALDIHTIGCGGGSLVRVDAGGVLHVGPESAGADPGPVAYGRGEEPTVTDAHVLLGHVAEGRFVAGELALDVERVRHAFERLAGRLGTSPEEAARGVLDVARAAMRRALSVMTMKRGKDPRRLPLVAFGGAGGLHAAALAESLEMPGALVPRHPGVLSAWGMANADALRDHARTVLEPLAAWSAARRAGAYAELAALGRAELVESGHRARAIEHELALDLRYRGQNYELSLPEPGRPATRKRPRKGEADDVARRFHERHAELYGYRIDERELELVGLRVRSIARRADVDDDAPARAPRARAAPARATLGTRAAWFGRKLRARVVARDALLPGHRIEGPALVEEFSGTTLVPPRWTAGVTHGHHLWLTRG